ncbi:hypothetical protein Rt10032_c01g0471 [Rhodotorula toruloides]|uniref:Diphthamide biosynthesis protein 3 n=1 Tax=Rhodotorula toruloides TaxID=5286 RepID=A0A511KAG7_RHOTO|nr:hypothetical protein Rt10032_c01g0471 [Rhodotorula toruloides]
MVSYSESLPGAVADPRRLPTPPHSPTADDELEIEDFAWDDVKKVFHYPCPCGDRFEISRAQLAKGEEVATCPSCSLLVRVVYDMMDYEDYDEDEEEEQSGTVIPVL